MRRPTKMAASVNHQAKGMNLKLSRDGLDAMVTRHNPHCLGWCLATVAVWGHDSNHDLDEPVRLTDEVPVRLRYAEWEGRIVTDRKLAMRSFRAGTHCALRFYFKNGRYFEQIVEGLYSLPLNARTVEVDPT